MNARIHSLGCAFLISVMTLVHVCGASDSADPRDDSDDSIGLHSHDASVPSNLDGLRFRVAALEATVADLNLANTKLRSQSRRLLAVFYQLEQKVLALEKPNHLSTSIDPHELTDNWVLNSDQPKDATPPSENLHSTLQPGSIPTVSQFVLHIDSGEWDEPVDPIPTSVLIDPLSKSVLFCNRCTTDLKGTDDFEVRQGAYIPWNLPKNKSSRSNPIVYLRITFMTGSQFQEVQTSIPVRSHKGLQPDRPSSLVALVEKLTPNNCLFRWAVGISTRDLDRNLRATIYTSYRQARLPQALARFSIKTQ